MSWSATPVTATFADFPAAVAAATVSGVETPATAVLEQLDAAKAAANAIFESGAVGDSTHTFIVSLNGHANTDHQPDPGWANDYITVSVTQAVRQA